MTARSTRKVIVTDDVSNMLYAAPGNMTRALATITMRVGDLMVWRADTGTPPLRVGENEIGFRRIRNSAMEQVIAIAEIEVLVS